MTYPDNSAWMPPAFWVDDEGQRLLNSMSEGVLTLGRDGLIRWASQPLLKMLDLTAHDLPNRHPHTVFHQSQIPQSQCPDCQAFEAGAVRMSTAFLSSSGQMLPVRVSVLPSSGNRNGKSLVIEAITDETERVQTLNNLALQAQSLQHLFDQIPAAIYLYQETFVYANAYFLDVMGYTLDELREHSIFDTGVYPESQRDTILATVRRRLRGEQFTAKYLLEMKKKTGETFWTQQVSNTIFYQHQWMGLGIWIDNPEIVQYRELAETDSLLAIPNRRAFDGALVYHIQNAQRSNKLFSLVMFDIDHFKTINDTYGHAVGDRVLQELVSVIQQKLRAEDILARFGGEEFMLILPGTTVEGALTQAQRLCDHIASHHFTLNYQLTCSFGVGMWSPGQSPQHFLRRVDAALYRAKARGRNRVERS